tara:strand:+ start:1064 stop:1318 length:255 start_codon:yes stop_codon:yes gene_type:complete
MNFNDICNNLTDALIELNKIKKDDKNYSLTVDLFDYGYLDSFGVVELLAEISARYDIDLTNEDFYRDLRTIESIAKVIENKKNS